MNVPISQIKPNPKNPRVIKDANFEKLKRSIQEFPEMLEKRPLVCYTDSDGKLVVLGGNMRLKAAKELKIAELPVILADDWTAEQKEQFIIRDNVSGGEWDFLELNDWQNQELSDWGVNIPNLTIKNDNDFEYKFKKINDDNCIYPIVPIFDEDQEMFIITCENEIDANWLREKLGMQKMKSYKRSDISKSNIISVNDLKNVL
jgi:hypothetical protein